MTLDLSAIRSKFSFLNRPAIFLDNPAGTQIAKQSLERINHYLLECNANHEGLFEPTRNFQFHGSPGHRKDKTVILWSQIPKMVMGYNQRLLPISFSELSQ